MMRVKMKFVWAIVLVLSLTQGLQAQETLAEWRAQGARPAIIAALGDGPETYQSNVPAIQKAAATPSGPREIVLSSGETFTIDPSAEDQALLALLSDKFSLLKLYNKDRVTFIRFAMLNDWVWATVADFLANEHEQRSAEPDYGEEIELLLMLDFNILKLSDFERDAYKAMMFQASEMLHHKNNGVPAKQLYADIQPQNCAQKGLC